MDTSKNTLSIKRTFDSPIDLVWDCYTNPDYIIKWFSPNGMKTEIKEYNFNIDGNWEYIMSMQNGLEFVAEGVFTEIKPKERITREANFRPKTEGVILETIFEKEKNKTNLIFNVVHPT
ncbi:SRPBCC domain-containing protein [Tenacibaculum sp. MEBiC06402]|uniref:SRPBCC domain-containing protein n=1 Tax=unclassified Tenacibaculum TaxID=2635139 RepID=UPI003B9C015E